MWSWDESVPRNFAVNFRRIGCRCEGESVLVLQRLICLLLAEAEEEEEEGRPHDADDPGPLLAELGLDRAKALAWLDSSLEPILFALHGARSFAWRTWCPAGTGLAARVFLGFGRAEEAKRLAEATVRGAAAKTGAAGGLALAPAQQASARFWALQTLGRLAAAKQEFQAAEAHLEEAQADAENCQLFGLQLRALGLLRAWALAPQGRATEPGARIEELARSKLSGRSTAELAWVWEGKGEEKTTAA